jgi:hypothetical protein
MRTEKEEEVVVVCNNNNRITVPVVGGDIEAVPSSPQVGSLNVP